MLETLAKLELPPARVELRVVAVKRIGGIDRIRQAFGWDKDPDWIVSNEPQTVLVIATCGTWHGATAHIISPAYLVKHPNYIGRVVEPARHAEYSGTIHFPREKTVELFDKLEKIAEAVFYKGQFQVEGDNCWMLTGDCDCPALSRIEVETEGNPEPFAANITFLRDVMASFDRIAHIPVQVPHDPYGPLYIKLEEDNGDCFEALVMIMQVQTDEGAKARVPVFNWRLEDAHIEGQAVKATYRQHAGLGLPLSETVTGIFPIVRGVRDWRGNVTLTCRVDNQAWWPIVGAKLDSAPNTNRRVVHFKFDENAPGIAELGEFDKDGNLILKEG